MSFPRRTIISLPNLVRITPVLLAAALCASCREPATTGEDAQVTSLGCIEVTAQLTEIRGEFPNRINYDYVYVMKYRVLDVHRGELEPGAVIYVGHYNPLKARAAAADARVFGIGGNLTRFRAGNLHRMALEADIDEHYMGGIIDKYFGKKTGPIYWPVWTNRVVR
jgi:hypothetical protein